MENPKFQVFKSAANSHYYYRLLAKNGENILSSEGYTSKQTCFNAVASVKENAPKGHLYERKDDFLNYSFTLKAANGERIGRSENYNSSINRENGIMAVQREALQAPIEDLA